MAGKFHRSEDFRGPLMRIGFAWNLFETREQEHDGGAKSATYGCQLIAPRSADWSPITAAVKDVVVKSWGEKALSRLKDGLIHNPIISADSKQGKDLATGEYKPGLDADMLFIRCKTQRKPSVWNSNRDPVLDKDDCPSGWWGYPVLHAYGWHNPKNGDGVSFGIVMFQVVKEDEILGGGGGGDPTKYFESIATGETGEKPASAAAMFD